MEISPNIEIKNLALFLKKEQTLVIGDLHFGFEEALNKQGVLIPRLQVKEAERRLKQLLEEIQPKKVILVGDVKHEFGTISNQEWNNILRIFDLIIKQAELIIIKGNHDTIIKPITERRTNIKVMDEYFLGEIQFLHGDIITKEMGKIIIIGHEHPAVSFRERPTERFKCFLKGKYKNSILIVMPSFNFVSEGTDITKQKVLSPFLKKADLESFEVWISEDKTYYFGKLKELM